ncbi:bifunctional diguanylate cyclase/phosphodiesterase [Sphingomonas abietis]|uniref:EAL domain-containing protein n=1 Tax=Sphingomonas abietis TaxID=3012344 RepID=A0ABY7NYP3_9SPHN|nr:EAL domain-containing protein [Sphingomonas abietis]WBO23853.1 EAL domain-containing protein [Sphingomonas abietis]WBO24486.1 EAL domain-containing protein [Sphingomonas abietis]
MENMHDPRLIAAAGVVCAIGIYASFAIAHHAARATGKVRMRWGLVSVLSSGCTAWATHFIVLLAFKPGMPSAFEPLLTAASLASAIAGIGVGVSISIRTRRVQMHFLAGLVLGLGITALHYIGQAAYLVQGQVYWNLGLVIPSIMISLPLSGLGMVAAGSRSRSVRRTAAPLLLFSIAVLHFCGMAAMRLRFDPSKTFPSDAVSPAAITPVVAGVSLALIALALTGWRFDLAAVARLRQDRRRLRELADVALEGLLICQGNAIVAANDSVEQLAGYGSGTLAGTSVDALFPDVDFSRLPEREEREVGLVMLSGRIVPVRVLRCELALGHKIQTVIAVRDQRERLRTEAKIRKLAFNDSLTGLLNRGSYVDRLRHLTDEGTPLALLSIDLDRFKAVNDQFGHLVGDEVLNQVAERLRSIAGPDDFVARVGGDEFGIILIGETAAQRADNVARQVTERLGQPFAAGSVVAYCGATVGIVLAPTDATTTSELRQCADLALYRAKERGRGSVCCFDPEMDEASRDRRTLEADLRTAVADGDIKLVYQPVLSALTGEITSVEALARWSHPKKGPIPPDVFIPLAEECGLIRTLGEALLRLACSDAVWWPSSVRVAVNLSPLQFQSGDLSQTVESVLQDTGLAANRLQLEVTEGLVIRDVERTFMELERLRALGIQILMDDFGVGYSSLSYFQRFPFDKVKIDKSFVDHITTSRASRAIVQAVVGLGEQLGMGIVAEGVETEEQMHALVAAGCTHLQGYLFSKPLTTIEMDERLSALHDASLDGIRRISAQAA